MSGSSGRRKVLRAKRFLAAGEMTGWWVVGSGQDGRAAAACVRVGQVPALVSGLPYAGIVQGSGSRMLYYSSFTAIEITSPAKRGILSADAEERVWQPTHPDPNGMLLARR